MEREDTDLMLATARRWFRANQPLETRVAAFKAGHHEAPGAWAAMADMGWLGLSLPEAAGGLGAGQSACFALIREAGRDARPEPLDLQLLLAPLLAGAMPEHAEALAAGRLRFAMADTSSGPEAVRWAGTDRLEGQAGTVLGMAHASHLLLPVGQGDQATLALVDLSAPGIASEAARLVDGRSTQLIGCSQAPARRVGSGLAQQAIDLAAAAQIADSAGVLDAAFALTLDYLKQRVQFGKPL
ncbi:MAG: acyl-CoA dehydrogenase domain protein, partial [Rhodoferax sp.]|nr:acyl-CoA dehydrogenase domain protein [Rhodoferax sp.]